MRSGARPGVISLCVASLLSLGACLPDEDDDRPLTYEPGVYQGEPDRPLTDEEVEALRDQARRAFDDG
ncbi:MAG: hypothetical protein ACFB6S_12420 [Geminicoccaceae bacterium]